MFMLYYKRNPCRNIEIPARIHIGLVRNDYFFCINSFAASISCRSMPCSTSDGAL